MCYGNCLDFSGSAEHESDILHYELIDQSNNGFENQKISVKEFKNISKDRQALYSPRYDELDVDPELD